MEIDASRRLERQQSSLKARFVFYAFATFCIIIFAVTTRQYAASMCVTVLSLSLCAATLTRIHDGGSWLAEIATNVLMEGMMYLLATGFLAGLACLYDWLT